MEDPWRVFRIMGEFVEGFEELSHLGPAVTVFGSARTTPDQPYYEQCVQTARLLGEAGFTIITGGGPGNGSRTAVMYLYETAWKFFRFGYASSIAVVLAVIMIIVTVVLFSVMRRRAEY